MRSLKNIQSCNYLWQRNIILNIANRITRLSFWNKLFALILLLLGLTLAAGGGWLAVLGGNWYYVLAGIGLIISAVLIFMKRSSGATWFALVFIGTLIWTIQESGLDYWRWVPRFALMLILGMVCLSASHTGPPH